MLLRIAALSALLLALRPSGASAQTATDAPFAAWAGKWERRDADLLLAPDGYAYFRWKVGACQGPTDPNPCDDGVPGHLAWGGLAEMYFGELVPTNPPGARGHITLTAKPDTFVRGSTVTLTRVADDLVLLTGSTTQVWLCRPPREINFCDAP